MPGVKSCTRQIHGAESSNLITTDVSVCPGKSSLGWATALTDTTHLCYTLQPRVIQKKRLPTPPTQWISKSAAMRILLTRVTLEFVCFSLRRVLANRPLTKSSRFVNNIIISSNIVRSVSGTSNA